MKCADCGNKIRKELDQTPFETNFGILCMNCWGKRMGEEVEKHPIGGVPQEYLSKLGGEKI